LTIAAVPSGSTRIQWNLPHSLELKVTNDLPLEHQNVPTAHQGLHEFLYSAADEHGAASTELALEVDGNQVLPLCEWQALAENARVAGVYAVLDADRQTQYIGYSRNVFTALKGHLAEHGSEVCAHVRVQPFKFPKREEMEGLRDRWIGELAEVPPGNNGTGVWATMVGAIAKAAMSAAEQAAYRRKEAEVAAGDGR
jgi:hypothetical protein